jgi:hypothetical protein
MYYVFVLGPAGSGKSYLTAALSEWLEEHGLTTTVVNLDPAADWLPYSPDVDIRKYITVDEVMEKYNLGPNGALITAVDLSINYVNDLISEIDSSKPNYVLVDTPGQLEIFAFRRVGSLMIDALTRNFKSLVLFLLESHAVLKPSTMIPLSILSLATSFSHRKPQLTVITKIDLLSNEESEMLQKLVENPLDVLMSLKGYEYFMIGESLTEEVLSIIEAAVKRALEDAILTSAITNQGIDMLYAAMQRIFAGGEDFYTEEPNEIL